MGLGSNQHVDNKQKLDSIEAHYPTGPPFSKSIFSYDENENVIQAFFLMLFTMNIKDKAEYTYNVAGQLTEEVFYCWEEGTGIWQEDEKIEYSYNEDGKLILRIYYDWQSTAKQWAKSSKSDYTYDSQGMLIQRIESDWSANTSTWEEDSKSEYEYDLNNNLILQTDYDYWPGYWEKAWKYEFQYDIYNNLILELDHVWDNTNNQWNQWYKSEYTWDAQDNLSYDISYVWNETGGIWENLSKNEYQYDTSYSFSELIFPTIYEEFPWIFNKMITKQLHYVWYESISSWGLFYTTSFYYSDYLPGYIEEPDPIHFQLYPNPAGEKIYITVEDLNIDEVRVYSLAGQIVMQVSPHGEFIDISALTPGMYIVEVVIDGKKVREKLVVE
jgi:hypothetical protein